MGTDGHGSSAGRALPGGRATLLSRDRGIRRIRAIRGSLFATANNRANPTNETPRPHRQLTNLAWLPSVPWFFPSGFWVWLRLSRAGPIPEIRGRKKTTDGHRSGVEASAAGWLGRSERDEWSAAWNSGAVGGERTVPRPQNSDPRTSVRHLDSAPATRRGVTRPIVG